MWSFAAEAKQSLVILSALQWSAAPAAALFFTPPPTFTSAYWSLSHSFVKATDTIKGIKKSVEALPVLKCQITVVFVSIFNQIDVNACFL